MEIQFRVTIISGQINEDLIRVHKKTANYVMLHSIDSVRKWLVKGLLWYITESYILDPLHVVMKRIIGYILNICSNIIRFQSYLRIVKLRDMDNDRT